MKMLIGGSPCTHWSIAQTKNRETEASGIGWELFLNYRIARDKYQPDFFLYENNKSMSPAIRAQITAELGVEPVLINSAPGERTEPPAPVLGGQAEPGRYIQPGGGGAAGGPWDPPARYSGKRCLLERKRVCPAVHNWRNHGGRHGFQTPAEWCGGTCCH